MKVICACGTARYFMKTGTEQTGNRRGDPKWGLEKTPHTHLQLHVSSENPHIVKEGDLEGEKAGQTSEGMEAASVLTCYKHRELAFIFSFSWHRKEWDSRRGHSGHMMMRGLPTTQPNGGEWRGRSGTQWWLAVFRGNRLAGVLPLRVAPVCFHETADQDASYDAKIFINSHPFGGWGEWGEIVLTLKETLMSGKGVANLTIYLFNLKREKPAFRDLKVSPCLPPISLLKTALSLSDWQVGSPRVDSAEVLSVFDWYHYWSLVIDYCPWWNIQGKRMANSNHLIHHGCLFLISRDLSATCYPTHQANCWWLLCVYNWLRIYCISCVNQNH